MRILFCFQQVGGFNALLPLIETWRLTHEVILSGNSIVRQNIQNRGFQPTALPQALFSLAGGQGDTEWFKRLAPDIVITDTINLSRNPEGISVRNLWAIAEAHHIPSIAYMDCWWGYDIRFMLPQENVPPILPDHIAVVDEYARTGIIEAGLPPEKIRILGSPRFEQLREAGRQVRQTQSSSDLKSKLSLPPDRKLITFVSQPLEKVFGSADVYGFTEKTTLSAIMDCLKQFSPKITAPLTVDILLHPEDDERTLRELYPETIGLDVRWVKHADILEQILASDLIVGMFSILLAESVILRRPVLSVQLNLKREEILITNVMGATLSVNTVGALHDTLFNLLHDEKYGKNLLEQQAAFKIVTDTHAKWNHLLQL